MPSLTFVKYEGTDEQIAHILTQLFPSKEVDSEEPTTASATAPWNDVARRFEQCVSATAAYGKAGQKDAMLSWLKAKNGEIPLESLWRSAGVASQHDYSGIGGSLTKNMVKSGGPREWYQYHVDPSGEWIYRIMPELLEPLRHAFGVKA